MNIPPLHLVAGSVTDYHALAAYHYRADRPASFQRIYALRYDRPGPAKRLPGKADEQQTAAVLVLSHPVLACRLREQALGRRYAKIACRKQRAMLINNEVRTISRVIVHPQWRGLGLAVQLVRYALDHAETPVTEALAAMGHIHPFFQKAGMTKYERPPLRDDARLLAAIERCGIDRLTLATPSAFLATTEALPLGDRGFLRHELARWYRTAVRTRHDQPTMRHILDRARMKLLCTPAYFVHIRTDPATERAADTERSISKVTLRTVTF